MKNALIVSLNFRVAHVSHLVASYKQQQELGYNSYLYIHPNLIPFIPTGIRYITGLDQIKEVSLAIFWFPAAKNLKEMIRLKWKYKAKLIYVFHEPIESFQTYRKFGLSPSEIAKTYIRYAYTLSFLSASDFIILPSKKAYSLYEASFGRRINSHYRMIPLLFDDERKGYAPVRRYFSYIGTIAHDHAYNEFIRFILRFSTDDSCPMDLKFLIATRNQVDKTAELISLIDNDKLVVQEGRPLSDDEINSFYAQSYCVWNAYHRTTQSGVLAKASMFGTPAIVTKDNLSEFSVDGQNVSSCDDNSNYSQIKSAFMRIINQFDAYSANSRKIFETYFNYKSHNKEMLEITNRLTNFNTGGGSSLTEYSLFCMERRAA